MFYELLKNPEALKAAQNEVDQVLGTERMTVEHVSKLPYISALIRETLRLHSTAPAFSVTPVSQDPADYPMHIGKMNYPVERDDRFVAVLSQIHRDPAVYGKDADDFRPERMFDEPYKKLPRNSWKVSKNKYIHQS